MKFTSAVKAAILKFISRSPSEAPVEFIENPSEEIDDARRRGKDITLYKYGVSGHVRQRGPRRDEENYLFSTRRFPSATGNVLPVAPQLGAQDYLFFSVGVGQSGDGAGFPTGFNYSDLETNLQTPNVVPQNQAFRLKQMGVSFNAEADLGDVQQLVDAGSIVFQKQAAQWQLRQGPAQFWPGGVGVVTATQVQGAQSTHNGIADWKAARYLKIPRDIHNLENFNYIYRVPRAVRATDATNWTFAKFSEMRVGLWGLQVDRIPD